MAGAFSVAENVFDARPTGIRKDSLSPEQPG